jgi:hypothetical protein
MQRKWIQLWNYLVAIPGLSELSSHFLHETHDRTRESFPCKIQLGLNFGERNQISKDRPFWRVTNSNKNVYEGLIFLTPAGSFVLFLFTHFNCISLRIKLQILLLDNLKKRILWSSEVFWLLRKKKDKKISNYLNPIHRQ